MNVKWLWGLLILLLVVTGVLGGMLFWQKQNQPKIFIRSEMEGLKLKIIDQDLAEESFEKMGIWQIGMFSKKNPDQPVKPKSFLFVLTDIQQKVRYQDDDGKVWASRDFEYDDKLEQMVVKLHYSKEFISSKSLDKLAEQVSRDMLFYPYIMAKQWLINSMEDYRKYDQEGKRKLEDLLRGRSLVFIIKE